MADHSPFDELETAREFEVYTNISRQLRDAGWWEDEFFVFLQVFCGIVEQFEWLTQQVDECIAGNQSPAAFVVCQRETMEEMREYAARLFVSAVKWPVERESGGAYQLVGNLPLEWGLCPQTSE